MDFERIALLLEIVDRLAGHPTLKVIRQAVMDELADINENPQVSEKPEPDYIHRQADPAPTPKARPASDFSTPTHDSGRNYNDPARSDVGVPNRRG